MAPFIENVQNRQVWRQKDSLVDRGWEWMLEGWRMTANGDRHFVLGM